jgi:hypothetical protein
MASDTPANHPHQQQITALVTLLSVLIGTLRADGVITADQAEAIFRTADHLLAAGDEPLGTNILSTARSVAAVILPDDPEA